MSSSLNIITTGLQSQGIPVKQSEKLDDLVSKAEDTIRRTTLQNASKTPAGTAVAAARYIATDMIKDSIKSQTGQTKPPSVEYLNSMAAINNYNKA